MNSKPAAPKRPFALVRAALNLCLGLLAGLMLVEGILRANPHLLLFGMATYLPVNTPLQDLKYDIRTSDADLIQLEPEHIQRILPEEDRVEAHVRYQTDELGFRNAAPLPEQADVVVLGRSFSLGVQATHHWPEILSSKYSLQVLNLAHVGSGIHEKQVYLENYGLPRKPRWVILEVVPSLDIIEYLRPDPLLVRTIPLPITKSLLEKRSSQVAASSTNLYPLRVQIYNRTLPLAFYSDYLSALTVSKDMLEHTRSWEAFSGQVKEMAATARQAGACLLLMYLPTRENIYFSIAPDVNVFTPAIAGVSPWELTRQGELVKAVGQIPDLPAMQQNASAGRDLLADFARENKLPFADPTLTLIQAIQAGQDPYMVLDTHFSNSGHQLLAQVVAETMRSQNCP